MTRSLRAAAPGSSAASAPARVYHNQGNPGLLALLGPGARHVLDVGCGAGDNAALLRARGPGLSVSGVTFSPAEAERAEPFLDRCWVFDIEGELPAELSTERFDVLLFSHVLEHLRDPSAVLARFVELLEPGGEVLIAVPNVLSWRQRLAFLAGRFEYAESGVLDATHLRFFTFLTAARYLLAGIGSLELTGEHVTGSVPLWWLRRHLLPTRLSAGIDALGCRVLPNLFGAEVLLVARKR